MISTPTTKKPKECVKDAFEKADRPLSEQTHVFIEFTDRRWAILDPEPGKPNYSVRREKHFRNDGTMEEVLRVYVRPEPIAESVNINEIIEGETIRISPLCPGS